ncbi:MAG: acetoacetate decarboxylase family protein [Myxococcales bacterium]|nr:acetoacetate decarboxylase family protein [Myxococcales bacterium]
MTDTQRARDQGHRTPLHTEKRFATPGSVPEPGEIWCPVGTKSTLYAVHLVPVRAVAPYVPRGLEIVSIAGRTLGVVFLSYYGPESTLEYHELIVMPALVRYRGRLASWVTHIYVDNELSVRGGRRVFGLPKEMAHFDWLGGRPGVARLSLAGEPLITVRYGAPLGRVAGWIGGPSISVVQNEVLFFLSRLRAEYGLCRVSYEIARTSPLAELELGRPLFGILGGSMRGYMGERQRILGPLDEETR